MLGHVEPRGSLRPPAGSRRIDYPNGVVSKRRAWMATGIACAAGVVLGVVSSKTGHTTSPSTDRVITSLIVAWVAYSIWRKHRAPAIR